MQVIRRYTENVAINQRVLERRPYGPYRHRVGFTPPTVIIITAPKSTPHQNPQ